MFALLPGKLEVFKEWSSSKMDLGSYNLKEDGFGHEESNGKFKRVESQILIQFNF
jgi:hypothetical protein